MTNSYVNPIGMYPNLGYNDYQYLTAAMSTPNVNSPSFRGTSGAAQTTTAQPQVQYVQAQPEKKNGAGKAVLYTLGAAGLILTAVAFKKGGDGAFFERIGKGYKMMFGSGAAEKAAEKAAETATEAVNAGKKTVQKIGDKTVVTLPGEKNRIGKNISDELKEIGEETSKFTTSMGDRLEKGVLKEGNKLQDIIIETSVAGTDAGTYTIIGANEGKNIVVRLNGQTCVRGERVTKAGEKCIDEEVYDSLVERVKDIFSGKTKVGDVYEGKASGIDFIQAHLKETQKDTGMVSRVRIGGYKKEAGKIVADDASKGKVKLLSVITDRFSLNHDKVWALRKHDSAFDQFLTTYTKEGKNVVNKLGSNLSTAQYTKSINVNGANKKCTFTVNSSGEVIAYQFDGEPLVDSIKNQDKFDAFSKRYEKLFEDIKKSDRKQWTNFVFAI